MTRPNIYRSTAAQALEDRYACELCENLVFHACTQAKLDYHEAARELPLPREVG